jgi:hypothetical protein
MAYVATKSALTLVFVLQLQHVQFQVICTEHGPVVL